MDKYYIDYGTGAGNEWVTGTLDDAKRVADAGAAYTQQSIRIQNDDYEDVSVRFWYGVKFDPSVYDVDEPNVIKFGDFGFYDEWVDVE